MREIDKTPVNISKDLAGQFGETAFKLVGDYAMKKELAGSDAWKDGGWAKTLAHAAAGVFCRSAGLLC